MVYVKVSKLGSFRIEKNFSFLTFQNTKSKQKCFDFQGASSPANLLQKDFSLPL